jgi:hypothetical protein
MAVMALAPARRALAVLTALGRAASRRLNQA